MNAVFWEGRRTLLRGVFPWVIWFLSLSSSPKDERSGVALDAPAGAVHACACWVSCPPTCSRAASWSLQHPPWPCPVDPWPESDLDQAPCLVFCFPGLAALEPHYLKLDLHRGLCFMVVAELL